MTRIYGAHAYSGAPIRDCFWAAGTDLPDPPALEGVAQTDVVVVGGGFTGLNAALTLAQAGYGVTVLEAEAPGWGASGRNGGFCCLGGAAASDAALTVSFGEEARQDWRKAEVAAIDYVAGVIADHEIDADTHSDGEHYLAHRPRDWKALEEQAEHVRRDYGVEARLIARDELAQHGLKGPFFGALHTPIGFALNPRKYVVALARLAQQAGAHLHARSAVTRIQRDGEAYRVETAQGHVTADRVIIATNGYSSDTLPDWIGGRYMPSQSSVIVTRPMTEDELRAQGWTSRQMCYDTRNLLHYFRLMPDNRMLFGMRGGLLATPRVEARIRRTVRAHFEAMFPAWAHVDTPHYWSGMVCLTRDFTPFAGAVPDHPGLFAGFGYHGNGVSMGSFAGHILGHLAVGRKPPRHPDVLKRPPGRFPLGRFRRALTWPVYAQYALGDL